MLSVALHGELLKISRETFQIVFVRENGDGLRSEKVIIPDGQQPHQHGQIFSQRSGAEMLIHLMKPVEHRLKIVRSHRQHRGEADRRIHGVATPDPIPEAKHICGINPKSADLFGIGRDGDKVLGDRGNFIAQAFEQPIAGALGVGHGLKGGEGFGGDHEERLRGVEIANCLDKVDPIDV